MRPESCKQSVLEARHLQFDIEESRGRVASEDLLQCGKKLKTARARLGNLNIPYSRIMADDGAAVGGSAHVEFKTITTMGQREIERLDCIFRDRLGSAGAAMTEEKWTGHLVEILAGSGVRLSVFGFRCSVLDVRPPSFALLGYEREFPPKSVKLPPCKGSFEYVRLSPHFA